VSWDRPAASAALAALLSSATADLVTVHPKPPSTLNAPALVVGYPQTVTKHTPTFAVDLAALSVIGAYGIDNGDALDDLLNVADAAIGVDPTLGLAVQHCRVVEWRNWRTFTSAGANLLLAELALEIRM
jgi:hypothetical protein